MMNCRNDLTKYYSQISISGEHVVEIAQEFSHSRDLSKNPIILTNSHRLDEGFLLDSERYIGAALLQFLAHSYLDSGGYITWAEVTRYYSRFFGVTALPDFLAMLLFGFLNGKT